MEIKPRTSPHTVPKISWISVWYGDQAKDVPTHCPKNKPNLGMIWRSSQEHPPHTVPKLRRISVWKKSSVTNGTVGNNIYIYIYYIYILYSIWHKNQTNTVAFTPSVTGSIFMQRFCLTFGTVHITNHIFLALVLCVLQIWRSTKV